MNLAAQTISGSVATALEFLKNLGVADFVDCEPTIKFINRVDKLFDILNSRSPWAKGYKAPMKEANEDLWRSFFADTIKYLSYCTNIEGIPLWKTTSKTPIIGFIVSAMSCCGIFDIYVKNSYLNYLLTYKCSQDHLEIFFCAVR